MRSGTVTIQHAMFHQPVRCCAGMPDATAWLYSGALESANLLRNFLSKFSFSGLLMLRRLLAGQFLLVTACTQLLSCLCIFVIAQLLDLCDRFSSPCNYCN